MLQLLDGFQNIANLHDHYIFDVSGVLTDGTHVFEDAINCLQTLEREGKQVIMLSNAPRLPKYIAARLNDAGINASKMVTSGGFVIDEFKNPKIFKGIRGKCYKLGDDNNDLWHQTDSQFNFVDNINEADFFISNKYFDDISLFDQYLEELEKALELNLPCVCANPDIIVYHGDDKRYPQGYIADKYENMGGKVYYYGKPYKPIYDYVASKYTLELAKTLMIGDNIFTDVRGAKGFGIDSLLITSGNHRDDDIAEMCEKHKLHPNFQMDKVKW